MNGWTFGIVYELRLTRRPSTLPLPFHPEMTPRRSQVRFDVVAFGDEISHYSRLNGVNQGLVEFQRGIGGSLGSLMSRG